MRPQIGKSERSHNKSKRKNNADDIQIKGVPEQRKWSERGYQ